MVVCSNEVVRVMGRALLTFLIVFCVAFWAFSANALSEGASSEGASSEGGSPSGSDRDPTEANTPKKEAGDITRGQVAPVGFVLSDDVCQGGKFDSCN